MTVFLAFIELAIGGVFLWLGGEAVVRGSASLAFRRGLSQLVVGLTIIGFGTSAPELFVSLTASLQGNQDIAIGNVLGSNIANLGLVLGISALIRILTVQASTIRLEIPFLSITAGITWFFSRNGLLERKEGVLLLGMLVVFLFYCLVNARKHRTEFPEAQVEDSSILPSPWLDILFILLGFIGLIGGSKLFVLGAITTARLFGVSEFFIGLSIVALGTSLPELAASIIAVLRNKIDLALGNLVGSNLFNLLLILGCVATIHPIRIPAAALRFDFPVVLGLSCLLFPLALTQKKISRWEGILFLGIYTAYIFFIIARE
ncbi:calcium/sodium antiporter [bacterium]|nr:calcium/sodium antiporter [bacterium]